jgi:hypothetical protein
VVGLFMHSDVTQHGNLTIDQSSSDGKILAAVHASVVQTQACNIYSVPTDCPQVCAYLFQCNLISGMCAT